MDAWLRQKEARRRPRGQRNGGQGAPKRAKKKNSTGLKGGEGEEKAAVATEGGGRGEG